MHTGIPVLIKNTEVPRLHGSEQQTGHLDAPPESISLTTGPSFNDDSNLTISRGSDAVVSIGGDGPDHRSDQMLGQLNVAHILPSSLLSNIFGLAFNRLPGYEIVVGGTFDVVMREHYPERSSLRTLSLTNWACGVLNTFLEKELDIEMQVLMRHSYGGLRGRYLYPSSFRLLKCIPVFPASHFIPAIAHGGGTYRNWAEPDWKYVFWDENYAKLVEVK
ncbi:hypothetical protein EV421DRAFT_1909502 [Armillaria borealis]|uniref:Uncharacterized protein n=1 Tax=Armillaria borealis TaxID=47425 RepID=A0AA39MH79_9AGAR|nr:hypothetical protein EV421DRAFT_1909502 [Armillaria borealis]